MVTHDPESATRMQRTVDLATLRGAGGASHEALVDQSAQPAHPHRRDGADDAVDRRRHGALRGDPGDGGADRTALQGQHRRLQAVVGPKDASQLELVLNTIFNVGEAPGLFPLQICTDLRWPGIRPPRPGALRDPAGAWRQRQPLQLPGRRDDRRDVHEVRMASKGAAAVRRRRGFCVFLRRLAGACGGIGCLRMRQAGRRRGTASASVAAAGVETMRGRGACRAFAGALARSTITPVHGKRASSATTSIPRRPARWSAFWRRPTRRSTRRSSCRSACTS
jgi:hypothetical protein